MKSFPAPAFIDILAPAQAAPKGELRRLATGPAHFSRHNPMNDQELASLLEEAGYQYNVGSGRYDVIAGATAGEEEGHSSEFIADELGIPHEDLQRWEEEQIVATGGGEAVEGAEEAAS